VPAIYAEALGLYIVEAWAAGVPVVQPRHAAFTELVEGTGAGRLFASDSVDDLIAEWSALLSNPALARELGALGRAAVLEGEFALARMAESYLAATREALGAAALVH
jgi:glycosyltransferase involved in cell wall biosynthesis